MACHRCKEARALLDDPLSSSLPAQREKARAHLTKHQSLKGPTPKRKHGPNTPDPTGAKGDYIRLKFIEAAQLRGYTVTPAPNDRFHLQHSDPDKQGYIALTSLRQQILQTDPLKWDELVDHFIDAMLEFHVEAFELTWDLVRHKIFPKLSIPFNTEHVDQAPLRIPLIPPLFNCYLVADLGRALVFLNEQNLITWGKSLGQVFELAQETLLKTSLPAKWRQPVPNVFFWEQQDDSHISDRALILKDLIEPWPELGVIVMVPRRDALVYTPVDGFLLQRLGGLLHSRNYVCQPLLCRDHHDGQCDRQ